jgi:hypothetical protein
VLTLEYRVPGNPSATWLGGDVMLRVIDTDAAHGQHLRMKIASNLAGRVLLPHSLHTKRGRLAADPENLEKPLGQWNHLEIRCIGPTVTGVLNDHVLPAVNGVPERLGRVGLNCHATDMEFRQIKVAEIVKR